ncbi:hypothetical protein MUN88_17015 [Gracilibacillus caseinilyticus]|uniref:DUF4352 domain-containing protein n=1 Tax=Gracilibacillus caseinilyticus TaxID=2932256 RepID=A0ABY4EV30_9BACI|nr:hypothetical protein [Gracilibacillus caseinilyticus]UOQ47733.1 hypothetical protein MUN88_17015 [Gracilibacillus caseinilyticus]
MKKCMLLSLLLMLTACSNNEAEQTIANQSDTIKDLENTIEEQANTIESQKNTIAELEDSMTEDNHESEDLVNKNENGTNEEIPTLALGETYSDDEIEVTIHNVEYLSDGVEVFFEVHNKSEEPLEKAGSLKFTLDEEQFEEEFNRLGYGMNFDNTGYIYEGEKRKGSYNYIYDRDVTIKEIKYHYSKSGVTTDLVATWRVE